MPNGTQFVGRSLLSAITLPHKWYDPVSSNGRGIRITSKFIAFSGLLTEYLYFESFTKGVSLVTTEHACLLLSVAVATILAFMKFRIDFNIIFKLLYLFRLPLYGVLPGFFLYCCCLMGLVLMTTSLETLINEAANQPLTEEKDMTPDDNLSLIEITTRVENQRAADENWALIESTKGLTDQNERLTEENKILMEENEKVAVEKRALIEINKRLTSQNKTLTIENERVSEENQRVADENRALIESTKRLTDQNERLTGDNQVVIKEKERLADEKRVVHERNESLTAQNEKLTEENQCLIASKERLIEDNRHILAKILDENGSLVETKDRLTLENCRLRQLIVEREENSEQDQRQIDWIIERSEVRMEEHVLGKGGWGSVRVGTFRGTRVAVKKIHELVLSRHNRRLFEREMRIAASCRHPCLLQFIGATNDDGNPLFVTELLDSNLRDVIVGQVLKQKESETIAIDVACALNYLHKMKPSAVIHRDISSSNILLWKNCDAWRAKLSDYGSANFIAQCSTAYPGCPLYSAPEAGRPNQTEKVRLTCSLWCNS